MNTHIAAPTLGLTQKERDTYSIAALIRAAVAGDQRELGRYGELSEATRKITGQPEIFGGYYLPGDLLGVQQSRALSASNGAGGGYLVGSTIAGYAAALDRASLLGRLGVTRLDDLRTDVTIASQTSQTTIQWVGENVAAANSTEGALGQISMTPRTVIALFPASLALLRQAGPAGERFIQRQLGVANAQAWDSALFQGTGGAQPLGLTNIPGVDTRTGSSFDMAAASGMLRVVEAYANDDSIAWVAGIDAAETLRKRAKVSGGERFMVEDGKLLDRPFYVSRGMSAAGLICAPWSSVMFGSWGAPELRIDTATGFNAGSVRLGVFSMVDVAVERPASIAIATAVS